MLVSVIAVCTALLPEAGQQACMESYLRACNSMLHGAGVQALYTFHRGLAGCLLTPPLCASGQLLLLCLCVSSLHESTISCMGPYEKVGAPPTSNCFAGWCSSYML